METLHSQKENADTDVVGNNAAGKVCSADTAKFSAPKRGLVINDDAHSSKKKGLKDIALKSRRVLGDISNNQRSRHGNNDSAGVVTCKKGLRERSNKPSTNKKTPLKPSITKAGALHTPRPQSPSKEKRTLTSEKKIELPHANVVPDIEIAYGGLPSPKSESAYIKGLRDEIRRDITYSQAPTLFDDFDPTRVVDDWDDSREKTMLESEEPSVWWASPDTRTKQEAHAFDAEELKLKEVDDNFIDLPPPDNLSEDAAAVECDLLLEDILSVDIEAVCSE